ncbi:MAG: TlpA family protein disulfide reductase [Acidobacteria bacterium]|nr:TlpA family protein disulfide reductase [Acidobacteriota bacterium]
MPPFRLSDLDGKVWTLRNLKGKKLVVAVWSTWSGPCQTMLPQFERLCALLNERTDVQVLSMNVDEDTTPIQPYMDRNRLSFPVVPAITFVGQLVGFLSVPRLWIIDETGKWTWEQVGFDSMTANWEAEVLHRLG